MKLSFPGGDGEHGDARGLHVRERLAAARGHGNVEFAALFAPKPQGMTTANDWTREMSTKGFPDLKQLYALLGSPNNVMLQRGEYFPHNYNAVTRSAFYTWLNRHFKLGFQEPVIERDYVPLTPEQLTVWDASHPAPKADDADFERRLLNWLTDDAEKQLAAAASTNDGLRKMVGGGIETAIGRTLATAGEVQWQLNHKNRRDSYVEMTGVLRNKTHGEELPVVWLYPKKPSGRVVIWLGDAGKASLYDTDGYVKPAVLQLINGGADGIRSRLALSRRVSQGWSAGNAHADRSQSPRICRLYVGLQSRVVRSAGARRSDLGKVPAFRRGRESRQARKRLHRRLWCCGADRGRSTSGGRRDHRPRRAQHEWLSFWQAARLPRSASSAWCAKYLDVPGLLALGALQSLWLAGEGKSLPLVDDAYRQAGKSDQLNMYAGEAQRQEAAASEWLLK